MEDIQQLIGRSSNRVELCIALINDFNLKRIAELGVFRGDFAKEILERCPSVEEYTMIDPWRNLSDWNKPANKDNDVFEVYYQESIQKTDFAKEKRRVLRGKTTEVIDQIDDNSLDFVYIDGDHTLKGITIDLIAVWPKIKENGFIIGDDFSPTIWQHSREYEPTMVFPFAIYFAEAMNAQIYGLPYGQFLIAKNESDFEFMDLTNGEYSNLALRTQFINEAESGFKTLLKKNIPFASKIYSALKK
jgi:hypothetical protein